MIEIGPQLAEILWAVFALVVVLVILKVWGYLMSDR